MEKKNIVISEKTKRQIENQLAFLEKNLTSIKQNGMISEIESHLNSVGSKVVAKVGFIYSSTSIKLGSREEANNYRDYLRESGVTCLSILRANLSTESIHEVSKVTLDGMLFIAYTRKVDNGYILHLEPFIVI